MRRRMACLILGTLTLAGCGDGPTAPPVANGVALVISPGGLLLAEAGAQQALRAYAIDADGDSTLVEATFQSSDPGVASIGADGVVTGGATLGSAQIVATSGDLTSAPLLVLRATPAAGALLVADSQVIGEVEAVDPSAPYDIGRQYRVRLRGASPAVGQIVLATGAAPIGGRVVSASAGAGESDVVLEMVPLGELFQELSIDARLPLNGALPTGASQNRHGIRLSRSPTGGTRFSSPPGARFQASAIRTSSVGGRIEQEFELGPFKCKMEVPAPIVVPISMSSFTGDLNESLVLDIVVEDGIVVRKFVVDGTIRPALTIAPRITAALEGKGECKWKVREFPLPITGVLSAVLGGQVPLGIGFEIGAKATLGQLGADVTFQSTVTAKLGFDCTGACQWVQAFDATAPDITVKPVIPDLGTSTRIELGASGFGWAELTLGLTLWDDETTRLKLLSAKAGLEQKFELASADAQAADPAYASSYSLKPIVEVKAGAEYTPLENLLQVTLTVFTYAPEIDPISRSARGAFTITPASVAPGDDTQLGDLATFTVTLTDATYLGAYAVEAVQILWRRQVGETVVLESGRPGCTDLEAAQGQLVFACQTDFPAEHAGAQTFHAFVKTRIFGVPVPVPLEIAADAKAAVTVGGGLVSILPASVTLAPGQTQIFTATVSGSGSQEVTWSATGGTYAVSGNTLQYTAGSTAGTYAVTAASVADPARIASAAIEVVGSTETPGFEILGVLPVSAGVSVGQCSQGQLLQGLGTSLLSYQSPVWQCTANEPPTTIARANVGFSISGLTGTTVSISANGTVHLDQDPADEWIARGAAGEGFSFRVTGGPVPFRLSGTLTVSADGYAQAYITGIELTKRATAGSGPIQLDEIGLLAPGTYSLLLQAGNVNDNLDAEGAFEVTLKLGN